MIAQARKPELALAALVLLAIVFLHVRFELRRRALRELDNLPAPITSRAH